MILKGRRLKTKFVKRIKSGISYSMALFLIVGLCSIFTPVTAKAEGGTHTHNGITFQPWTSTDSMPESGNYYLENDVVLPGDWTIENDLRICLNGHSVTMGGPIDSGCIDLESPVHFALYDEDNTGYVTTVSTDYSSNYATVFIDNKNAVFEMYGGRLCGTPLKEYSSSESDYTCIRISEDGGTVRIYGGCLERGTVYNIDDHGFGTIEVYNAMFTKEPNSKFVVGGLSFIKTNPDPATSSQYPYIVSRSGITISYELNDGTGTVDSFNWYIGTPTTIPKADKDDYKLLGWSTSPTAIAADYVEGEEVSFDKDTTLYAIWQEKLNQNITSTDEITVKYGTEDYVISATTDGDGTLSYEVKSGDSVSVDAASGKLTTKSVGDTVITIKASSTNNYKKATKDITVSVEKGIQIITSPNEITLKVGNNPSAIGATTNGDGALSYEVTSGDVVTVDANGNITPVAVGNATVTVTAAATNNYNEASKDISVTVSEKEEPKTQPDSTETKEPSNPKEPTNPNEPTDPENLDPKPNEPSEPGDEDLSEPEIPDKDWLDDFRLTLRIADELGGERTVEYSGDFALSYDIMKYLEEHPLITLIYHVTYEDVEYTITIPAGKAIADPEIPWYGPLWLLANYGGKSAK